VFMCLQKEYFIKVKGSLEGTDKEEQSFKAHIDLYETFMKATISQRVICRGVIEQCLRLNGVDLLHQ